MLSDTFKSLQNKVYTDSRDMPVSLTEEHIIDGTFTDENRKMKLGEKVHSFQNLLVYKAFKSSPTLEVKIIDYDGLAIFYSQIDLTVDYVSYDSTTDIYKYKVSLIRGDTLEAQSKTYDITGSVGANNILRFDTIWGNWSVLVANFISGAKVVFSMMGYESSVLILDSFNPFIGNGATNHLFFNIPANSIYINELPVPFSGGNICVLVRYMGMGSVITAESLNDIISIVKYYNLLPKYEVVKNNNNDVQLMIRGEYYYLGSYVERIDDATYHIEDEILLGQWNAIISFLDIPNHIFNLRRVAVGNTYNNLIADITNFMVENPEYEMPIFILIFDTNKNLFEHAFVNRNGFSISGTSSQTVNKYNITFTNTLNISFSMLTDKKPVVMIYDAAGNWIVPDMISSEGTLVEVTFIEAQSGSIAAIN